MKSIFKSSKYEIHHYGDTSKQPVIFFPGYNNSIYGVPYIIDKDNYSVYVVKCFGNPDKNRHYSFEILSNKEIIGLVKDLLNREKINNSECILAGFSNGGLALEAILKIKAPFKSIIMCSPSMYLSDNYKNKSKVIFAINEKEPATKELYNYLKNKLNIIPFKTAYGHYSKCVSIGLNYV